jgi:phosphatidylserine/phosphatidylglycerophosphate/cardiolipin synthase-like enzyme
VQKFYWKDVYARLVAEQTGNRKFRYKIVPLKGKPGKLVEMTELPILTTNEVDISASAGDNMSAYFNRGLISTQRISRYFDGKPNKGSLVEKIAKETDDLRASLSGDMVEALTGFMGKAKKSGKIYAALYELGDEQLISMLEGLGKRLYIVLSNSVKEVVDETKEPVIDKNGNEKQPKKKVDDNQEARDRLDAAGANKWDRIMASGHIGHNKFLVYVNSAGKPKAVLLGSTNWTPTGLCTQTNNTIIIEDDGLAKRYLDYWNALKKDTEEADNISKNLQGATLRGWGARGKTLQVPGTESVQTWFSPNTPKARGSNRATEKRPNDMAAVEKCINSAEHAILFLAFYPGAPCISNWAALALRKNKKLFVRGCVTNNSASEGFYYELKGSVPPKKVKGEKKVVKQDPKVIAAEAFDKGFPDQWQKEILSAGFAIIHDKIMVIDPFSDNCTVISGSHNLGHKASYDNDENLVIIKGNRQLAMAYASHVLDVYDHFAARAFFKKDNTPDKSFDLKAKPEEWLSKYYDEQGKIKAAQLNFWMRAAQQ